MSALDKTRAAAEADVADRVRCSCLPFCFWRGSRTRRTESRGAEAAPGKRRLRRRFRLRLPWLAFSWRPWIRKSGKKDRTKTAGKQQRRGTRLLLLLKTSLQVKKALASVVVSGDSSALLPATVSSFGDAKKQSRSKQPRPSSDGTAPSGTRSQPQASMTATSTSRSTAPARPRTTNQPCTTAIDGPAMAAAAAGRISRAPSWRQHYSLQQPDSTARPAGLWTAASTLGVIVLFGRVTAVVFLCSCLYGARFVRARTAGAKSSGGLAVASSSRRFSDPIGVAAEKVAELCVTEECKKKVVMAGLLERPGNRPSSRFGR